MHVVVLGAGYAGLTLTRLLEDDLPEDVEITLVNESPEHLVQHELHRVIRRPAVADGITIPLREVIDRATVRVSRVDGIDTDSRTVALTEGTLSYDVCAVCLGAETAFYELDGIDEHAVPLKRLHHARRIRSQVLEAIDRGTARLVVGGAGLSGIQVAGELAALLEEEGVPIESNEAVDPAEEAATASVTILEQTNSVAPSFPTGFQDAARDALENYGVDVRTETAVTGADAESISVDVRTADGYREGSLPYDVFVWTGGIRGPESLAGDRPVVRRDLRLDDRTFVLGDAARVVDVDGQAVPASAQSAVREARTTATNVARLVEYERDGGVFEPRLESFSFDSPGWLISVGDDAVAQVGPSVFTGRAAKALKTTVGVGYLSSVGAIRAAVELVQNEFELGTGRP